MGVQKCCGQESCAENYTPAKNDRRCQLINEIKELIGNIEQGEKAKPRESRRPDRGVPGMRDLEDECRQWRKRRECTPPLITKIALHETRPTSDYSNMKYESSSQVTYVDATTEGQEWRKAPPAPWDLPRTPSQELRAGNLYSNCQCLKRNGLQSDCPRWECAGRPECVAVNPGPCCLPSQSPKPVRGDRRYGNKPQKEVSASSAGTPDYKRKQLKTGPLNYDICIPNDASPQGPPGGVGPEATRFIRDGKLPQAMIGARNVQGFVPSNQANQMVHPQGKRPMDLVVVLDMNQIGAGVQRNQPNPTQSQGATEGISLTGPGMTCCCRPVQSAPASGSPEMVGVIGIPMIAASAPVL